MKLILYTLRQCKTELGSYLNITRRIPAPAERFGSGSATLICVHFHETITRLLHRYSDIFVLAGGIDANGRVRDAGSLLLLRARPTYGTADR